MLTFSTLGEAVVKDWYALEKEYPQLWGMCMQLMEEYLHVVVFPELFKVVKDLKVKMMQLRGNEMNKLSSSEPSRLIGMSGMSELGSLTFAAIGKYWLQERGVRMQVRCHNNTTVESIKLIERQKEYFLDSGKERCGSEYLHL